MIYNQTLSSEYGAFLEGLGQSPQQAKPRPTKEDYKKGNFTRSFAKKANEGIVYEINPAKSGGINDNLYRIIHINWVIAGNRDTKTSAGITDFGVVDLNKLEIDRVMKEEEIDLRLILNNPLEYWQGY